MKGTSGAALLQDYLESLHETHVRRRTPELSYRAALENLLNAVGELIDPKVHPTAELADTGSGHPDFGLQWTLTHPPPVPLCNMTLSSRIWSHT